MVDAVRSRTDVPDRPAFGFPSFDLRSVLRHERIVAKTRRCFVVDAAALSVPSDLLVFDDAERGPDEDLRLEFESTARLDPDEKQVVRTVIRSLVLQHEARRLGIGVPAEKTA